MAKTTVPQYLSATTSIIDSGDATAITIDGSENVAIGGGTNHDGAALLISHGDSGVTTFSDNADELVIENSTNAGISILTPNNASGSIIFGDSDDDDIGKIVYNHNDNVLTVTATSVVLPATSFGDANITNVGDIAVDTVSGDGDADTKIKIGTPSDGISIHCGGADQVLFVDGAIRANTNNDIDLGSSSKKFKDYYGAGTLQADGNATIGGTLGVTGAVTANAGVVVDNITIDGTEIDLSSGDMTIDIAGNLRIDCDDAGEVRFYDGGTQYGVIKKDSDRLKLQAIIEDKDILFAGNDGGSEITALSLDMSEAGYATFNNYVKVNDRVVGNSNLLLVTHDSNEKIHMDASGYIKLETAGTERVRIDANGNVGIGAAPTNGGISTAGSPVLSISGTVPELNFVDTSTSANDYWIRVSDGLQFGEASDSRMYLKNGGDLGIGTTSPTSKLTVTEAGDGNTPTMHIIDSADTEVAWFEGQRAADTGAFISIYHNPSSIAESNRSGIRFQGQNDADQKVNYGIILQRHTDYTDGTEDGEMQIHQMVNGTVEEKLTITPDQLRFRGDAGSSIIRVDNRADGHDTGFEIYQNTGRKWEIYSDDSNTDALDIRNNAGTSKFTFTQDGELGIGTTQPSVQFQIDPPADTYTPTAYNDKAAIRIRGQNGEGNYAGMGFSHEGQTEAFFGLVRATATSDITDFAWQIYDGTNNYYREVFRISEQGLPQFPRMGAGSGENAVQWWSGGGRAGGMLIYVASSKKYKKDITDCKVDSSKIYNLKAKSFKWNEKSVHENKQDWGMIAEDVIEHIPELGTYDEEGEIQGLQYEKLSVLLLEEIKKLEARITELESS
tara:strand:+ start:167 stop:2692 length:2526 start_codon:yes stop_codon:yes gene_type:complete